MTDIPRNKSLVPVALEGRIVDPRHADITDPRILAQLETAETVPAETAHAAYVKTSRTSLDGFKKDPFAPGANGKRSI